MPISSVLLSGVTTSILPLVVILSATPQSPHLFAVATLSALFYIFSLLLSSLPHTIYTALGNNSDDLSSTTSFFLLLLPQILSQFLLKLSFVRYYRRFERYVYDLRLNAPPATPDDPPTFHLKSLPSSLVAGTAWAATKALIVFGT